MIEILPFPRGGVISGHCMSKTSKGYLPCIVRMYSSIAVSWYDLIFYHEIVWISVLISSCKTEYWVKKSSKIGISITRWNDLIQTSYYKSDVFEQNTKTGNKVSEPQYSNRQYRRTREEMKKTVKSFKNREWNTTYFIVAFHVRISASVKIRPCQWVENTHADQCVLRAASAHRAAGTRLSPPRAWFIYCYFLNAETWARDATLIHQISVTWHQKKKQDITPEEESGGEKLTWFFFFFSFFYDIDPHSSKYAREMSDLWCCAHVTVKRSRKSTE